MHDAAPSPEGADTTSHVVRHATCLGCGCACDDIDVVVERGRIVEARNACALGRAWFGDGAVPGKVRLEGRDAFIEDALDAAAMLLGGASRPLVYLAPEISCEVQREGVAIADVLRATLDTVTSATTLPLVLASQERGWAGATLGEIRNRSDVIVFWGVDPAERYPRYWSRYAPAPEGALIDGRGARRVIAVDVGTRRAPADADARVAMRAADEIDTLVALGALASVPAGREAEYSRCTGAPWALARALLPALLGARYATLVFDAEPPAAGWEAGSPPALARADALIALAQTLNGPTRCALSALRAGGNRSGAEAVLTAHTGFPTAIDFGRGYPRYEPHAGQSLAWLSAGDVDAALVLGSVATIPEAVRSAMTRVRCAVVGPGASAGALGIPAVVIDTGVAGIHEGGTALRMDDVPLPLRPSLPSPYVALDVVRTLRERLVRTPGRQVHQSARTAAAEARL